MIRLQLVVAGMVELGPRKVEWYQHCIRTKVLQRRHTSNLVFSAIIRCIPIPTPSMTANKIAQPIAELRAALIPPLTANAPPVKKPAITMRQGYQYCQHHKLSDGRQTNWHYMELPSSVFP